MLMDELAKLELKWKEQVKINETLKLQLAAEEDRYKVSARTVHMSHFLYSVASFSCLVIHYSTWALLKSFS